MNEELSLKKEKSCGCIIIEDNKVLLIYEKGRNFWGFPKGHVEAGENEIQTATREVKEEVGIDVVIDESKRYELNYNIRDEIDKTSVYFIAKPKNTNITMQEEEIEDAKWCTFDEALELLTFDNSKEMLKQAMPKCAKRDRVLNGNAKRDPSFKWQYKKSQLASKYTCQLAFLRHLSNILYAIIDT